MKDDRLYLIHVRECIERIEQYTLGGKDAFFTDAKTQDAVFVRSRPWPSLLSGSGRLKASHPEVDWRNISAFRNVVVHGYLSIDHQRIWDIVESDLPDLKAKIEAISLELAKNP